MFEIFLWATLVLCIGSAAVAYLQTRDCFHPLMVLTPILAVLYWFMPWKLSGDGSINSFLDSAQMDFVQTINFCGCAALIAGCFAARGRRIRMGIITPSTRLLLLPQVRQAAYIIGATAFAMWSVTIFNVGGLSGAFGTAYGSGWSETGYLRDAILALLPALLLLMPSFLLPNWSPGLKIAVVLFSFPLVLQGILGARRGPTFMIGATLFFASYLYRGKRPAMLKMMLGGALLSYLVLFLVTNRGKIYLGSTFDVSYSVSDILASGSGGNEYIYGAGAILSAENTGHFYWGRRYLAQIAVRPVPRQWWPTKYADFGVPELEVNAGTGGVGLKDTLGWAGIVGAAPGVVSDFWLEFHWLEFPVLALIGWLYGRCWRKAVEFGGPWILQYIVLVSLSLYFVMQTGEAVIFRLVILSTPIWVSWRWAFRKAEAGIRLRNQQARLAPAGSL
jgi:hypothetical protein